MEFKSFDKILTCEHSSDLIPPEYSSLFKREKWEEHQIHDIGAMNLAVFLADKLDWPLHLAEVSRLLIDLNRSCNHPKVSLLTKDSEKSTLSALIKQYHEPFRKKVRNFIKSRERVLHIGVHSFTRNFEGKVRDADIGILYDPKSPEEKAFSQNWISELRKANFIVKANYPYKGSSDGHTTELRSTFPSHKYLGIELEICNDILSDERRNELYKVILKSLK